MDHHLRERALLCIVVCIALVTGACGGSGESGEGDAAPTESDDVSQEGTPVDGGDLVFGVDGETSGWKPGVDQWGFPGSLVGSSVYEPLAVTNADGEVEPWLATRWEPNETFTDWTITLREGVTFHDGTPFDAAAAEANFDYYRQAPLASIVFGPVVGDTEAIDDMTIVVHLQTPWASFPESYLASQSSLMQAPSGLPADSDASTNPVGTGPFVFDEWVPDSHFRATANPDYWREGEPHLDAIEFRVIPDSNTRAAALRAGDIDMIVTGSANDAADLDGDFTVLRDWDVIPNAVIANTRAEVNGEPNPGANLHARLAIAHAIDTETNAATVGEGVQIPSSPFGPSSPWSQPDAENGYPAYDPDAAREELQAYLDETGEEELSIEIIAFNDQTMNSVLALMQQQLEAVGIDAAITQLEQSALITAVIGATFEFAAIPQYSAFDPDQNYHYWTSATAPGEGGVNINFTGFYNDVTEEQIKVGRESPDFDTRHAAYSKLVREMNENANTFWQYFQPFSIVAADEVGGLTAVDAVQFADYQPKPWLSQLWISGD